MDQNLKISLQEKISQLVEHDIGCQFLAVAGCLQLKKIAREIVSRDLYSFPSVIKAAANHLKLTDNLEEFVADHLEHILWVGHREALWRSGRIDSPQSVGIKFSIKGIKNLRMTKNFPIVLISPMTLAYADVLWIARKALKLRDIVIYGEGLVTDSTFSDVSSVFDLNGVNLVGADSAGVRKILGTLNKGGIFLTYPDFVYSGHKVQYCKVLGMKWPFSSSFISICSRNETMLLPCYVRRKCNTIFFHLEQPLQVVLPEGASSNPRWSQQLVGTAVAQLLTNMIIRNPVQWLLLSSVIAECNQRAMK